MKKSSVVKTSSLFVLGVLAVGVTAQRAFSWPSTSPSARSAARLKYHPPANWLRHYLPDDRYKVAGKVWKVVSTQYDTYCHRPDCPNMLRQSPDIVIGFAGITDAHEAGYKSDPTCSPEADIVIRVDDGAGNVRYAKGARRVSVANGRVSLALPTNWKRVSGKSTAMANGFGSTEATFRSSTGATINVGVADLPGGIGLQSLTDPDQLLAQLNSSKSAWGDFLKDITFSKVSLGGVSGIRAHAKPGSAAAGASGDRVNYLFASGGRMIMIDTSNTSSAQAVLKTLRLR